MTCDHIVWYGREFGLVVKSCIDVMFKSLKNIFILDRDLENIMKTKGEFFKYCPLCGKKL